MAGIVKQDARRDLIVLEDTAAAIAFATDHWLQCAAEAIKRRGRFTVALSGGSTPKAIYQALSSQQQIDWNDIYLFWSDERPVPPDHPDSNYHMAMEAGLKGLIPTDQIYRMRAESDIERRAQEYEAQLPPDLLDLVMLGVGEEGHTASLFPGTAALESKKLVVANFVPKLNSWRMTFTLRAINESRLAVIYALGAAKQPIVQKMVTDPKASEPASRVGTSQHRALWIVDRAAAPRT